MHVGLRSSADHHSSLVFPRFQQQLCLDHGAVQRPFTGPAFSTLKDAVRRLLPYHSCSGHLPTQGDFSLGQCATWPVYSWCKLWWSLMSSYVTKHVLGANTVLLVRHSLYLESGPSYQCRHKSSVYVTPSRVYDIWETVTNEMFYWLIDNWVIDHHNSCWVTQ